jgi:DNA mismatch endonuclease (patch repair protein)
LHDRHLAGRPDILLVRQRTAIFCDGDFWHGRQWAKRRQKLVRGSNGNYWVEKIAGNIRRARKVNRVLRQLNWDVIRVWESDIADDPERVADEIMLRVQTKATKGKASPQAVALR